uniref:Transducin/WD40 repeat-like superfamily protein n=1 Tax=Zea mays TaxID=4577 RepID=A0A804Q726_MAIZE
MLAKFLWCCQTCEGLRGSKPNSPREPYAAVAKQMPASPSLSLFHPLLTPPQRHCSFGLVEERYIHPGLDWLVLVLLLNGRICSMDFHSKATNYLVTASDDESIRLYDTQDAVCLNTINSKKYGVGLVCFTDNPSIVLYSSNNGWDESLRLLSMNDNRFIRYYKGHLDRVVCIALCSGKENFLSCSLDRTILLWDHRAEKPQGLLRAQRRPTVSYDAQGMGPFATFSVGTDDSEAHVVQFSGDGRRILLTTKAGRVHVLDSFEGNSIASFRAKPILTNSTLEASFCPEGNHIVSGSGDGSVYAWNVESGKVACWESTDVKPPRVRWSPGSLMFVTGTSELSCWVPDLSKLESFTISHTNTRSSSSL